MRRYCCIFFIIILFCPQINSRQKNVKPFVIPELKEWRGGSGVYESGPESRIVCMGDDSALAEVGRVFAEDYMKMFGTQLEVVSGKPGNKDFIFRLAGGKGIPEEGYRIFIGDRVEITAATPKGAYWATRTILQILEQDESRSLPCGHIYDYPSYPVRGFMLDCGRKFFTIDFLRDYVKFMSYYKINTFQIHLNDNGFSKYFDNDWDKTYAAFRLESDMFPGLAAEDGFYTKKEFIDLQIQAEERFVEIIPEIDVPAHSLAFSHYRPSLGSEIYGMDHLKLDSPETYSFLDSLFREYLDGEYPVFRGPRVNIGTDEYSNKDSIVVEQFRAFTDHYIRYVEQFGKQACMWGALTHAAGQTPVKSENVIMNMWYNPYAHPKDMKEQGYKMISIPDGSHYIVPQAGYYHDYLDCRYLYGNWIPSDIAGEIFEKGDTSVLGGMFAVWNDHVGNGISMKDVHHRVLPAMQTLATKMWSGEEISVPFEEFDEKRHHLSEAPGVNISGKIGQDSIKVYWSDKVIPGMELPYEEIGYDYTVSFDIDGCEEIKGTELFRSRDAVFYLSDPIRGLVGFARDGYLYTFNYRIKPGKVKVTVTGDSRSTKLYIDGSLVEELGVRTLYYNEGKDRMYQSQTLVFPLGKAGAFRSDISGLEVYNYMKAPEKCN